MPVEPLIPMVSLLLSMVEEYDAAEIDHSSMASLRMTTLLQAALIIGFSPTSYFSHDEKYPLRERMETLLRSWIEARITQQKRGQGLGAWDWGGTYRFPMMLGS